MKDLVGKPVVDESGDGSGEKALMDISSGMQRAAFKTAEQQGSYKFADGFKLIYTEEGYKITKSY